jgi:hypothetical protein
MLLTTLPVKVPAASTSHETPPSTEWAIPKPGLPASKKLLVLPVPANISFAFKGLRASDLMASAGNFWSVSGCHVGGVAVPLVVFQIPPLTAPT